MIRLKKNITTAPKIGLESYVFKFGLKSGFNTRQDLPYFFRRYPPEGGPWRSEGGKDILQNLTLKFIV